MYSEATKRQIIQFVTKYGSDIVTAITDSGLFFPAVVAQLTLESKYGQYDNKEASDLATKYNNWGGIKDSTMAGTGSIKLTTQEGQMGSKITTQQVFATYPQGFPQFMQDYVRILHLPTYVKAGVYNAADAYAQLLAIARGGYSTDNPDDYLRLGRSRIEACLDNYPWGKINSAAANPVQQVAGGNIMEGVNSIIKNVLQTRTM
jgi:flagellum-specific peptidoglycan hydrolase FlgJ